MSASPPVSIGLPVFNGEHYLENALSDLRAQTMPDFELLISDNASTDATREIALAAARDDPRIRYVRQPENLGAAANYNYVFHHTGAPFFRWASHDDGCAPTHLERCLDEFGSRGDDVVLVYPRTMLIDANGDAIGDYDDRLQLLEPDIRGRLVTLTRNWRLCNPVMNVMRREAAQRTRLIDTFRTSDLVLLAELAMQGKFVEHPEPLFLRRIHPGSALQGEGTDAVLWLDPNSTRRRTSSRSTLPVLLEVLRSVERQPLPRAERLSIQAAVATAWLARRTRVNGGRLKARLRELSGSLGD